MDCITLRGRVACGLRDRCLQSPYRWLLGDVPQDRRLHGALRRQIRASAAAVIAADPCASSACSCNMDVSRVGEYVFMAMPLIHHP